MADSLKKTSCVALIVAAGEGVRAGGEIPKQYQLLAGKSLLSHSVRAFLAHPLVDAVAVVIRPEHRELYEKAVAGLSVLAAIEGGETRQESVRLGLGALQPYHPQKVLIHDAARPLVSAEVITRCIEELKTHQAALPVLPVTDSIKTTDGTPLDRGRLKIAQTPQGFAFNLILDLHRRYKDVPVTDDIALAEHALIRVAMVEGDVRNFKITTAEDMQRAVMILEGIRETRVGSGFDVHRLIASAEGMITLCGVPIPHTHKLEGHSDADVALHAVVDAILGSIGEGDIGTHFPPSDARWKGKDSAHFVQHAASLLAARGGSITHIDVTLICEQPKLAPHRQAMRKRLAEIIGITVQRVSVKATTSEGLGFTGRGEGIAAQATVTITLPAGSSPSPFGRGAG